MLQTAIDVCLSLFCLSLSVFLYKTKLSAGGTGAHRAQGYLLHNQVTHARLLPVNATNAFTYPTLALLASVNALEDHRLDLWGGWIFGFGGTWGRIVGLRSDPYLTKRPGSIKRKLEDVLRDRGHLNEKNTLEDAWIMTMPSFLGFEGINPLTVYFCYNTEGAFWATILEIHNTFGESHVHVLEIGRNEDSHPSKGYDHQWTFPREFHVSPFNDRSGFYTVSIKRPTHTPIATNDSISSGILASPKPSVRVHLYTASEEDATAKGVLKLTALLRPTHSTPLTTLSLLSSLAQAPFALLLTAPRILFVAWKLHYQKRLDVYLRPEPLPAARNWGTSADSGPFMKHAGGIKWLDAGLLDKLARTKVIKFLEKRTRETGIEVTILASDPSVPALIFSPDRMPASKLTISYLSCRIFTILFLCPSAEHALLLGSDTEGLFRASSKELFRTVFGTLLTASTIDSSNNSSTRLQRLRCEGVPPSLGISIPRSHFLDNNIFLQSASSGLMIYSHRFLDWFEKCLFMISHARVVEGQEPWKQWDRAASLSRGSSKNGLLRRGTIGSVVQD